MEILEDLTIGGLLHRTAALYPDRIAMEYENDSWTYAQIEQDTDEIARGFLALGVERGSHVGIWAGDRANTLLCLYAALSIGAVAVMLGGCRTGPELTARAAESDVSFLLFDEGIGTADFPQIFDILPASLFEKTIFIGIRPRLGYYGLNELLKAGTRVSGARLIRAKESVCPADPDMILFTSGTTDAPKGVLTTHFSRVNNALAQAEILRAGPEDKFLCALPVFHCFSLSGIVLAAVAAGACVCLPKDRHIQTLLKTAENCRCTVLTAVPTLFSAILSRNDLSGYDLSSLRIGLIGGSLYPPELFKRICRTLGYTLIPSLGQTEATAGITAGLASDSIEARSRTVGRFLPHVEGCLMDDEGRIITEADIQGEICIRGYNVMLGYYKRPDLTERVIDPSGWLHTGDIGRLDSDGNLTLTGRRKELIIRGGENIAPGEIEQIIGADERVAAVKVIGVPDGHYIEEICACIVREKGADITPEEISGFVENRLSFFKVPRYVIFFNELPVMKSGKPDIEAVRKLALEQLGM